MNNLKIFIVYILILFVFLGCKTKNKNEETVVAKVNDISLTENQMKNYFTKSQWDTISVQTKRKFIDDWVNLTVLENKANEVGLSEKPIVKSRIEASIKKIKANALLANEVSNIKVNENEEYSFYKIHNIYVYIHWLNLL